MNDTHYEAVLLINQLSEAITNADPDAIVAKFDALIEHTEAHYKQEEEAMAEKKFPPYAAHKEDHDGSLAEMREAASDFTKTKDVEALRAYVDVTLIPWFLRHTETMDAVTSIFLENSEAHLPYWERLVPRDTK
jgi:hemerythrin